MFERSKATEQIETVYVTIFTKGIFPFFWGGGVHAATRKGNEKMNMFRQRPYIFKSGRRGFSEMRFKT